MLHYLKKLDYFGRPIKFYFNKNGEEHRTKFGGFCSIIVRILFILYFALVLSKMIRYGEDRFKRYKLPHEARTKVTLKEAGIVPYFVLMDSSVHGYGLMDKEEAEKYFKLKVAV